MNKRCLSTFAAGALAALLALPGFAATAPMMLGQGATAPDFTAPASLAGHSFTFSLKHALAKGPVVLYFFPAAFTQGCDLEAHTFSTRAGAFAQADATIIGVSEDSLATLDKFSSAPKFCAGKFPVASDPSGSIGAMYGVQRFPPQKGVKNVRDQMVTHGFFARTTFVIDPDGKVVTSMVSQNPVAHVTRSLAIVRDLQMHKAP